MYNKLSKFYFSHLYLVFKDNSKGFTQGSRTCKCLAADKPYLVTETAYHVWNLVALLVFDQNAKLNKKLAYYFF